MCTYPYKESQLISRSFSENTGVGISDPAASLLLETVYIKKKFKESKKEGKELSSVLSSPKTQERPRKGMMKRWGKGDLVTVLKHNPFLL